MSAPIVTTKAGKVQGFWQEKGKIAAFKGIPFAKPPVGDLRWRAPQPLDKWEGIKKTTKFGPFAWQQFMAFETFINTLIEGQGWNRFRTFAVKSLIKYAPKPKQSEDCLYLNVKTPTLDSAAKLPVMVWIHGGDHQDGSSAEIYYDGTAIPNKKIVLVTINYRLGLMGYFTHPELTEESENKVSGNYGTLDQIAALKWVSDNIAAFGGDPENVTIFGESAGGESVSHMLCSPLAKGLFHKAIMQSPANGGQMMHLFKPFLDYPRGEERGVQFAAQAGVTGDLQLAQLRSMPAQKLYEVIRQQQALSAFYPVIDGYVLTKSPFEAFFDGDIAKVPVLLGSNADEGTLIYPIFNTPMMEYRYRNMPSSEMPDFFTEAYPQSDIDALCSIYPGLEKRAERAEVAFLGDNMFGGIVRFYAEQLKKAGQPAYFYFFNRIPPSPKQRAGAFHAAELPFVHGTNTPILPLNEKDKKLSTIMVDYWTQFAKTGNPNGNNHPEWTSFDPQEPQWMILGADKIGMESVSREAAYNIMNRKTLRDIEAMKEQF